MSNRAISKVLNLIKVDWMIFWRLFVLWSFTGAQFSGNIVFWFPIVISLILVLGFNRTILTFPIFKILRGINFLPKILDDGSIESDHSGFRKSQNYGKKYSNRSGISTKQKSTSRPNTFGLPIIETATRNGKRTGFEPHSLYGERISSNYLTIGTPGKGLNNASHMSSVNIALGQSGETNFAKALNKTGLNKKFMNMWSVSVPDENSFAPHRYGTDIDSIVITGDTVYLVDLKNYKSGDVIYRNDGEYLYTFDNGSRSLVGEPKKMSHNMEMATKIMRNHFPKVNFIPVVVLMPTDKGEGTIDNVFWPGGIKAVTLTDFLDHLSLQPDYIPGSIPSEVAYKMKQLVA